ncbi:hypothetical protein BT69DRAFT_265104 [Atractiella rhizophila]|nr:hypothetical protein BT69DRAFT_456608 [Atractiella rhizophila]KAH8922199.1 hypothetical protein BT69DRAFT_265104 [Atractiella rhizophila]
MCGKASDFDDEAPPRPKVNKFAVSANTWRAPGSSERHIEELNTRIQILEERLAEEMAPVEQPNMAQYRGGTQGLRTQSWNASNAERMRMRMMQERYARELEAIHQAEAKLAAKYAAQQEAELAAQQG